MKKNKCHDIDECLDKTFPKRKKGFLTFYLVFVLALTTITVISLVYVSSVLNEYETYQPDKLAADCMNEIKQAAEEGRLDKVLSFAAVKKETDISQEEYEQFQQEVAKGKLSVKKSSNKDEEKDILCYNIILNGKSTIAKYKIKSEGQETRLAIFTLDLWKKHSLEATMYSEEFSLPASVPVYLNGEKAEGSLSEDGKTASYKLCSITEPNIVITDALGNSAEYSNEGKYSFKEYKITVPSNFTVMGRETISPLSENQSPIDGFANIYEYFPDMPVMCGYDLFVMENGEYSPILLDNYGQEIDISEMGDVISITEQTAGKEMPQNIENPPDPLEIAKLWSLFMTNDLNGDSHGLYTMEKYLFKNTAQYKRAREWATGIDITFTSVHSLSDPPFTRAEVKNFIGYSDKCFSCEIYLEKPLHIVTGDITDTLHSVFYFGYMDDTNNGTDDPHWGIIEMQGVVE